MQSSLPWLIGFTKDFGCVIYQSKSGNQIIKETNISHTSAYGKIKWLVEGKLPIVDKIEIAEEGKKSSLFRYRYQNHLMSNMNTTM